jgi:hypothetical protein
VSGLSFSLSWWWCWRSVGAGGSLGGGSWRFGSGEGTPHCGVARTDLLLAARGHSRAAENRVVNNGEDGEFSFKKDAARNRRQEHQERRYQDQKARAAGKAERAAERGSAQYGYGSSASAGPGGMGRFSDQGDTG